MTQEQTRKLQKSQSQARYIDASLDMIDAMLYNLEREEFLTAKDSNDVKKIMHKAVDRYDRKK